MERHRRVAARFGDGGNNVLCVIQTPKEIQLTTIPKYSTIAFVAIAA
jgi:hypothetical protein